MWLVGDRSEVDPPQHLGTLLRMSLRGKERSKQSPFFELDVWKARAHKAWHTVSERPWPTASRAQQRGGNVRVGVGTSASNHQVPIITKVTQIALSVTL
jgi:hypothetical protein